MTEICLEVVLLGSRVSYWVYDDDGYDGLVIETQAKLRAILRHFMG